MRATGAPRVLSETYELQFAALEGGAHGVAFPCDAQGHVDLDAQNQRIDAIEDDSLRHAK
jgi:hypothetical protein